MEVLRQVTCGASEERVRWEVDSNGLGDTVVLLVVSSTKAVENTHGPTGGH